MHLESWRDGPAKSAITDFVGQAVRVVPPEERVAVFDNDGTLWVEKPAYIQLDFLVRRLADQAEESPALLASPPYRAAAAGDLRWFGEAFNSLHTDDDSAFKLLTGAIFSAYAGLTVEEHSRKVAEFFACGSHPTLQRPYTSCGYAPMVELLRYLEDNGFTNYIASGGGRDFMRPIATQIYGIPPERVIGSSAGLDFSDGHLHTTDRPEFLDDGPAKPVRIWDRVGRRPIFAAGNSNGDIEMLQFSKSGPHPSLQLLIRHDDAEREFDYVTGAERSLELSESGGWTVVSINNDWSRVFP